MKHPLLGFFFVLLAVHTFGQTTDSAVQKISFAPKLEGSLKTKVEFNTEDSQMRFEVRNARLGARGNVNEFVSYRAEIELSDEGNIKMLDAYVKISPVKNLNLYLGQRKVPFGTDYMRSPVESFFANRSFVAKYVNNGLRDIGFAANYSFTFHIPVDIWLSAMNGTGNNNPQWIDRPNYSARLAITPLKNFRLVYNFYEGSTLVEKKLKMVGGEIRYKTNKLLIETEYLQRNFTDTSSSNFLQDAFYIHSYYNFFINHKMIKIISPVFRWDYMGTDFFEKNNAERITAGINFSFEPKLFKAEIRIQYEDYLKGLYPSHFDKFTIEWIARF